MPTTPLPDRPDLAQLRTQAKELRRRVQSGDPAALAEVTEHHPDGAAASAEAEFRLADAQLVVARSFGFPSWARLKRHVEVVAQYTRRPDRAVVTGDPVNDFLLLACLAYGDDSPERRQDARRLWVQHPDLASAAIHVAAATADADQVRRFVHAHPSAARTPGGPHGWDPLMYLAYSRVDPDVSETDTLDTARVLLDAGADPDAGFLHNGLPSAFTALTGVLGEGELGPERQPRHPHWRALARVLLEAGAEPNDSQGLYNRMFEPGNDHLELLFGYGLGTGSGGPWRARLGAAAPSPADLLPRPARLGRHPQPGRAGPAPRRPRRRCERLVQRRVADRRPSSSGRRGGPAGSPRHRRPARPRRIRAARSRSGRCAGGGGHDR